jgi:hypothetical protein
VFEQSADMRETVEQPGQVGSVGIVHGQIVPMSAEPGAIS